MPVRQDRFLESLLGHTLSYDPVMPRGVGPAERARQVDDQDAKLGNGAGKATDVVGVQRDVLEGA